MLGAVSNPPSLKGCVSLALGRSPLGVCFWGHRVFILSARSCAWASVIGPAASHPSTRTNHRLKSWQMVALGSAAFTATAFRPLRVEDLRLFALLIWQAGVHHFWRGVAGSKVAEH
jgi:hypothetical protein